MNKRGDLLILKPIFELLMAGVIIGVIFFFMNSYSTGDIFIRDRVVREGALLADTMQSLPGNVWVTVLGSTSDYSFDFQKGSFGVSPPSDLIRYKFAGSDMIEAGSLEKPGIAVLVKNGDKIVITDKPPLLINKMSCSAFGSPYPYKGVKASFDAGTNEMGSNIPELRCSDDGMQCFSDGFENANEGNLLLYVTVNEGDGIVIKFPSDSELSRQSAGFGCRMINLLLDNDSDAKVWLLPSDNQNLIANQKDVVLTIEANKENLEDLAYSLRGALG